MTSPTHKISASNLSLVLDQGSHASRMAVFSDSSELMQLESEIITTHSPKQGFYEQDANEILTSLEILLGKLQPELLNHIHCCGLCTQRSTIVAWNKVTGKPLSPAISWQDLRSQPFIKNLKQDATKIRHISGLPLSAHYSASKMLWLLENNAEVQEAANNQQLCIAPLASFLIFHLVKGKPLVIDHSNAQRSQLFDIQTLNWSDELLALFKINKKHLPECTPVIHNYGTLKKYNIPLTTVCGDQNAVIYAYPQLQENSALINVGTGAFILSASAEHRQKQTEKLLRTITSSKVSSAEYVTEGTVNGAGAALSWAQQEDPCEKLFTELPKWLALIQQPPIFINTISGLGSPWWCSAGPAEFIGDNTKNQADRYVAIIESIVFLIFKNIQSLQPSPKVLFISGGLSELDSLCQKLADLSRTQILRFTDTEATARGCAYLSNQLINNNIKWKTLDTSEQFNESDNSTKHKEIINRYQQFVGELEKRCNRD